MRHWIPALIVALLAAPSSSAQTDTALQVAVGSRVRVRTPHSGTLIGELTEARGDTLVIRNSAWPLTSRTVVLDPSARVDVSRGRYVSGRRVLGYALGCAGATVVLYELFIDDVVDDFCPLGGCELSGSDYARAAGIGAAAGAVLGVILRAERWERVRSPLRVGVDPSHRQARFTVALTFR
ncbi:MAG TPA: hypothetical protein VFU01_08650 [Gemmatimonadaceae bacterium]|nr:hypothetical protein [Gemmatimonadaceae bacterium]